MIRAGRCLVRLVLRLVPWVKALHATVHPATAADWLEQVERDAERFVALAAEVPPSDWESISRRHWL